MYKIIDNLLSNNELREVQHYFESAHFPWYFQSSVAESGQDDNPEFYFSHLLYNTDTKEKSTFFELCNPIIKQAEIKNIFRVKANLYPNLGKPIENLPHIDFPFEHLGAIFYINTNNGVTILTHEEEKVRIDSIENRLLIFDASKPHQSTHCTDAKIRLNINFNFWNSQ